MEESKKSQFRRQLNAYFLYFPMSQLHEIWKNNTKHMFNTINDILVSRGGTGYMLDPTIRFERNGDQEKRDKYKDTIPALLTKFNLHSIEIIGLYVGARGTISTFFENFRRRFNLSKSMVEDIVISVLKSSTQIIHNHLYSQTPSS